MAKQHQLHMCYRQAGPSGNKASYFLYDGDCVGQGDVTSLKDRYPAVYDKMCQLTDTEVGDVYITPDASIHGLQYKQGCALVAKYDNYTPFFVVLRDIVVYNQDKFFIIESAVSATHSMLHAGAHWSHGHCVFPFFEIQMAAQCI